MSEVIIRIAGLRKAYAGGVEALKGIDLDIRRGEILALLGPNGAGKTTLISIICGIVTASGGFVEVGGYDNRREYRQARSMMSTASSMRSRLSWLRRPWPTNSYSL